MTQRLSSATQQKVLHRIWGNCGRESKCLGLQNLFCTGAALVLRDAFTQADRLRERPQDEGGRRRACKATSVLMLRSAAERRASRSTRTAPADMVRGSSCELASP